MLQEYPPYADLHNRPRPLSTVMLQKLWSSNLTLEKTVAAKLHVWYYQLKRWKEFWTLSGEKYFMSLHMHWYLLKVAVHYKAYRNCIFSPWWWYNVLLYAQRSVSYFFDIGYLRLLSLVTKQWMATLLCRIMYVFFFFLFKIWHKKNIMTNLTDLSRPRCNYEYLSHLFDLSLLFKLLLVSIFSPKKVLN